LTDVKKQIIYGSGDYRQFQVVMIEDFIEEDNCQIGIGLKAVGAVTAF
jgi:hypothetical protein